MHCASQLGREVILIHLRPPPQHFLLHRALFSVAPLRRSLQAPLLWSHSSFFSTQALGAGGGWRRSRCQVESGVIEHVGVGELLPRSGINRQGLATQVPKGRPRTPHCKLRNLAQTAASSGLSYSIGWLGLPEQNATSWSAQAAEIEDNRQSSEAASLSSGMILGWFLLGSGKKAISWLLGAVWPWSFLEFFFFFLTLPCLCFFRVVFLCVHVCVYD